MLRYRNKGWRRGWVFSIHVIHINRSSPFFFFLSFDNFDPRRRRGGGEDPKIEEETQNQSSRTKKKPKISIICLRDNLIFRLLLFRKAYENLNSEARRKWALILLISYLVERVCSRQSRGEGKEKKGGTSQLPRITKLTPNQAVCDYFSNGRKMFISLWKKKKKKRNCIINLLFRTIPRQNRNGRRENEIIHLILLEKRENSWLTLRGTIAIIVKAKLSDVKKSWNFQVIPITVAFQLFFDKWHGGKMERIEKENSWLIIRRTITIDKGKLEIS